MTAPNPPSTTAPSPPSTSPSTSSSPPFPPSSSSSTLIPQPILRPLLYATLILSPILLLLPPRKIDFYTFTLSGAWIVSAQEVAFGEARRAKRMVRLGASAAGAAGAGAGLVVEDDDGVRNGKGAVGFGRVVDKFRKDGGAKLDTRRKIEIEKEEESGGVMGMLRRLSRGKSTTKEQEEDGGGGGRAWTVKRRELEREELEDKGYGGVMLGEVREVLGRDRETGEKIISSSSSSRDKNIREDGGEKEGGRGDRG